MDGDAEFVADADPILELRAVAIDNAGFTINSCSEPNDVRREQLDAAVRTTAQPQAQFVPLGVMPNHIASDAVVPAEQGLSCDPPPFFYPSTPGHVQHPDDSLGFGAPSSRVRAT